MELWKKKHIQQVLLQKKGQPITFIHIPKCGGGFIKHLKDHYGLKVKTKGHALAEPSDGITFTIIRNPIDRYESYLTWCLEQCPLDPKWPYAMKRGYEDKNMSLNNIFNSLTMTQITAFNGFSSLEYWSQGVDIMITIDELQEFIQLMGLTLKTKYPDYNKITHKQLHRSQYKRGKLKSESRELIQKIYKQDVEFYIKNS